MVVDLSSSFFSLLEPQNENASTKYASPEYRLEEKYFHSIDEIRPNDRYLDDKLSFITLCLHSHI